MLTAFTTLNPDEPLATAVELMQHEGRHEFPVTSDGHLVGLLTRPRLLHAIAEGRPHALVADAMDHAVQAVDPGDMLETALPMFEAGLSSIVPVVRDGRLIGLLTAEGIAEFLAIQAARARAAA
jgi:CBS domain-containing protein